jgi:exodeoxyribonuclease VII large subunit
MEISSVSLLELNEMVKETIKFTFPETIWIRAEISELHENSAGHSYWEFIEKEELSDRIIARIKGNCWAYTYRMLKPYFENSTGEKLKAGMSVLISCTIEYHELYGISLNIKDIDPTFTLGDLARRRLEIIERLQEDGVFDLNKTLELSEIPQRIAVISSETAAGYGDFMEQLLHNESGFIFYPKLFPAVMQGEKTAESIILALDKIFDKQELFDCVVIIRGGGATAELSAFDNYELAFHCAQFPLPVITGIGHLRDESILDLIAHTHAKTPTAVAEFLVSKMEDIYFLLSDIQKNITGYTQQILQQEKLVLQRFILQLPQIVQKHTLSQKEKVNRLAMGLSRATHENLMQKNHLLALMEKELRLSSPETILKKGYSLTLQNGKIIKNKKNLRTGDVITTRLRDGEIDSRIM